jgi:DNA polymerase
MLLMGSTSLKAILSPDLTITKSRGNWFERKGIWMLPTYHPAALLRDPAKKREAWQDMQMLEAKLKELELPIDG